MKFLKKVASFSLFLLLAAQTAFATVGWKVDSYGNIQSGRSSVILTPGNTTNCRLSVSGSTLSIVGDDGNALSATNPCTVAIKSTTAGKVDVVPFTAPVSATFGAASDTDGNLFGISDVDWASTMPMFVGVIYDGTTPYFGISRLPFRSSGAASSALCQKADTDCDAQADFMILTTGLTLTNWTSKPITQVGWFDATYATTGGAWTFAVSAQNGFNSEYSAIDFTMPISQNGATASKYFVNNGGVAPTYTLLNLYKYTIDKAGMVDAYWNFQNSSGGTAGSGANVLQLALPYYRGATDEVLLGNASITNSGGTNSFCTVAGVGASLNLLQFAYQSVIVTTTAPVNNADQNNAARTFQGNTRYRPF